MPDIDMMPNSYRAAMSTLRLLKRTATALALVVVLGLVLWLVLRSELESERQGLLRRRGDADQAASMRKEINALVAQKNRLEQLAAALSALRGTGEVINAARAIDLSLNDGVWLAGLKFSRDDQAIDSAQQDAKGQGVQTGYFIVIPAEAKTAVSSPASGQAWRLSKTVELRGAALDHALLTDFMKQLSSQPGITDVRFVNSVVRNEGGRQIVEFTASIALLQKSKESL